MKHKRLGSTAELLTKSHGERSAWASGRHWAPLLTFVLSTPAAADPVQWSGNGHFYEAIHRPIGITWAQAQLEAEAAGGHLATLTSIEENTFVHGLIVNRPELWINVGADTRGPWLGGFQPPNSCEPVCAWSWITGEAFVYANWAMGEPNNNGGEDRLHYIGQGNDNFADTWNDLIDDGSPRGYILEIVPAAADQPFWMQRNPPPPPASPTPRLTFGMTYDSARQETVLFGGWDGTQSLADTWLWDGDVWTEAPIMGPSPGPRHTHAMAYDALRQKVVLFGGYESGSNTYNGETWEWDGTDWMLVDSGDPSGVSAPGPRGLHAMAYDESRQRVVLFGGYSAVPNFYGDTWEWDGDNSIWILRHPGDPNGMTAPRPRRGAAMAYDTARQRIVVFGGSTDPTLHDDTWEWDGSTCTWTVRCTGVPGPRSGSAIAYDRIRQVSILFGGYDGAYIGETWERDGTCWTLRAACGPSPRSELGLVYDYTRNVITLFGGNSGPIQDGDTWEYGPDCNSNNVPDDRDIAHCNGDPACADCNHTLVPDGCELVAVQSLLPDATEPFDNFSGRIAISGEWLLVGATLDDNDNGEDAGAVYVFRKVGTNWVPAFPTPKLIAPDGQPHDHFGEVALDGDIAVIGASGDDDMGNDAGSAYVLSRTETEPAHWVFCPTKIYASNPQPGDGFGEAIGLLGNTAVVGARMALGGASGTGKAFVFARNQGDLCNWVQVGPPLESDSPQSPESFGHTVAIDGDTIVVGAPRADADGQTDVGAAYVFEPNASHTAWERKAKLTASNATNGHQFSRGLDVHGEVIVIGADSADTAGTDSGALHVFVRPPAGWDDATSPPMPSPPGLQPGDQLGGRLSLDGTYLVAGAQGDDDLGPESGAVYVFSRNPSNPIDWTLERKLIGTGIQDFQRMGVPVEVTGQTVVSGNNGPHCFRAPVYVFNLDLNYHPPGFPVITSIEGYPLTAVIGEPFGVTLEVLTEPCPLQGFQWRKNGQAIQGATLSYLYIEEVQLSDSRNYDVEVRCGECSVISSVLNLIVCAHEPNGDMNGDGETNGKDVQHFVEALLAGSTDPIDRCAGDFDRDGVIGLGDRPGFVAVLLSL